MEIDYSEIGKRIAKRRKELELRQSEVEEKADIGYKYLSSIENAVSIPSIEVVMKLARALDTTPDEFLVGTYHSEENWAPVSDMIRMLDEKQLNLVKAFIVMIKDQNL